MATLRIRVRPGARASALVAQDDGSWLATLKSPPVDGKANAALIALVAARFGCRKAEVTINLHAMHLDALRQRASGHGQVEQGIIDVTPRAPTAQELDDL